jgi:lipopolysaccharide export system permease protein
MVKARIDVLRRSGEDTRAMETALQFKYSAHWMNLIVLLIGAALCHRYSRSGGLSQKFGVGLLLVFSYYILERIGLKMGENGALSPFWAAWNSHFIYAGLAFVMLYLSFRL